MPSTLRLNSRHDSFCLESSSGFAVIFLMDSPNATIDKSY